MDFLKHFQYFGVVFATSLVVATAGQQFNHDKLHWSSTNFKTLLTWEPEAGDPSYDVEYAEHDKDWLSAPNCLDIRETECDLTNVLDPEKSYAARLKKTISTDWWGTSDYFTPYKQSLITAVSFSLDARVADGSVTLTITDPLTALYKNGSLLTIRDVFQNQLNYRVSYQKVGSTRKKETDVDSNVAVVGGLEPNEGYCFSVAAKVLTRADLGAWSQQQCSKAHGPFLNETTTESGAVAPSPTTEDGGSSNGLRAEVVVGLCLLLLLLLVIIITSVVCCRRRRQRRQQRTAQML
ncbi:tissue factor-like isoform X1 [Gadus macrocephalus]|uniref:tissue factor-like isoform X1 n=1 Tax=Gadus macrocephalus TaxID=80720 RepID=UPI0028CB89BB|nr:tissue factor-like isoform X1 [Gadus macrocephalus]